MYFEDLPAAASTPLEPFAGVVDSILDKSIWVNFFYEFIFSYFFIFFYFPL
jgi:hypothetical protein